MFVNIRSRLTFLFSLSVLIIVGVYSIVLFYFFQKDLIADLDKKIGNDSESIEMAIEHYLFDNREKDFSQFDFQPDPSNWATEVWTHQGQRVFTSGASDEFLLGTFQKDCVARLVNFSIETIQDVPARMQCVVSEAYPDRYVIRTARLTDKIQGQMNRFLLLMGLGVIFILFFVAGVGYFLARKALFPISQIVMQAQKISGENLSERLQTPTPHDEIGKLATAFNQMFERLEKSFSQMRRFTSDAAHELRTPLSSIRAMGEVALRQPNLPKEKYQDIISDILEESTRLHELCESLLILSKAETENLQLKIKTVSVKELVNSVAELVSVLAEEKNINLVVNILQDEFILADPVWIRQALMNVVDNAIKYTLENTLVQISIRKDNGFAVIEVQDSGPGISTEHFEKIFDRFYRIDQGRDRLKGGAGLGLAIAQGIIKGHGGFISVSSQQGQGTLVQIHVPLAQESS